MSVKIASERTSSVSRMLVNLLTEEENGNSQVKILLQVYPVLQQSIPQQV